MGAQKVTGSGFAPDRLARIDRFLQAYVDSNRIAGATALVLREPVRILFRGEALRCAAANFFVISMACGNHSSRQMIEYSELTTTKLAAADERIAYGSEPLQFGELRLPTGSGTAPLIVLIHGGCWQSQYDIKHIEGTAAALTEDGFATWTVEYRRLGDAGGGWPNTFDDVARAVDHVRILAKQFPRIDTSRVVLMGHSAGGQLALWAATRRAGEHSGLFQPSEPLHVAGVVSLAGITDMAAYGSQAGGCNRSVTPLMGGLRAEQPERYMAVNPIERLPIPVPVKLIHGDADNIVPIAQSNDYASRARTAGSYADVYVVPGAGHFDLIAPKADAWKTVLRAAHELTDRKP